MISKKSSKMTIKRHLKNTKSFREISATLWKAK